MAKYRSWVECLKLANFPNYVHQLAIDCDLDITIDVNKGFLRETTYFTVEGDSKNIEKFRINLQASIDEYVSR